MALAPHDGVGVVAFTNGARSAKAWLGAETDGLLGDVLGVPGPVIRADVPHYPDRWAGFCGWYSFRGSFRDVQKWFIAGAEVFVRRGQLMVRAVTPLPALARGLVLHPDDENDPDVFRVDLSSLGIGTSRVVFSRAPEGGVTALHLDFAPLLSFDKRPGTRNPRRFASGGLGVAVAVSAAAARRWGGRTYQRVQT